jgi:tyrosyl-tRNA synthetase
MSRLSQSVERMTALLRGASLAEDGIVAELLAETTARRTLDLSDLTPPEQAALLATRAERLQPTEAALAERIAAAAAARRPFVAKLGIDPTGAEVHLGHSVPMLLLSRLQRMGHHVVLIVGDVTASIGDPSGRSDERPALTPADIDRNLATYRDQVSPFFDFDRAEFRRNGDWLRQVTLPRLVEIAARIPMSMPLQRDDFRRRLDSGHGLSLAEVLYSVVMALDSVEVRCDIELGGLDQYLNMQMCRRVMEVCGQEPEIVLATALIEGTDGTGTKMSKSRGNYVPLTAPPGEVFGKLMSVPDHLVEPYLRALSEWTDPEIELLGRRAADGTLHPMDRKKLLAGEVTAALHGLDAAMAARRDFVARFSRRSFGDVADLPLVADPDVPVVDVLKALGFATSTGDVLRLARQRALRLVVEHDGDQEQLVLDEADVRVALGSLVDDRLAVIPGVRYLKAGRKLARIPG